VSEKKRPYVYPIDRADELKITGWTEDGLIREASEAGYIVTKTMIRAWVKNGLIPPPNGSTVKAKAPGQLWH
jgi:hypothetical protein